MPRFHAEVLWLAMFQTAALLAGDPPSPPVAAPPAPPASAEAAADVNHEGEPMHRNLQVLLIMSWKHPGAEADLRRLEAVDGAFERLRKIGWRVGLKHNDHLRIVTDDEVRDLVQKLDLKSFPSVVALHEGEVIRSFRSGCTTPLDEYTFEWMRSGVSYRPVDSPTVQAPTVEWSGSYPLRGGHWSVDGDYSPSQSQVLRHLRSANHRHLIPSDWALETWSSEELRSLHDDLHEMNRPRSLNYSSSTVARGTTIKSDRYQPAYLVP